MKNVVNATVVMMNLLNRKILKFSNQIKNQMHLYEMYASVNIYGFIPY